KPNETTDSDERVAIRSPVRSPDNDKDDMDFQYDHKDDLSFKYINDDDNAYGSINP
ncbi:239_t:CDS:1, partial [Rhizophagus irregularis]